MGEEQLAAPESTMMVHALIFYVGPKLKRVEYIVAWCACKEEEELIPAVKIASWCFAALSSFYNCFHVFVSDRSADLRNFPLTGFFSAFSNPNFFFVRII
ncbi:unnamed protein product [Brassica rapa subsp. trilocularis]